MAVVAATAAFVATQKNLAKRVEAAMAAAAHQAHVRGETDPAVIRAEMLAARERVRNPGPPNGIPPGHAAAKAR